VILTSCTYSLMQRTPESERGQYSAIEMGVQNLFELLSFASTMVFPDPKQFQYPVLISLGAVLTSACCYAAFVRKERGHLLHLSTCIKDSSYKQVDQEELQTA
jgi:solute carrier family 40 (iron-regulated transporter), member 1